MNEKDRILIKKVANKTGVGISFTKNSLDEFKKVGIQPTANQLVRYMNLKLSAVALYTKDKDGNRIPYKTIDYINAVIKGE